MTTWNPSDKNANVTLSNGNLTTTITEPPNAAGVRGTTSKSSGTYFYKLTVGQTGWLNAGFANATASLGDRAGVDNNNGVVLSMDGGGGSGGTSSVVTNSGGASTSGVGAVSDGATLWIAVDLDNKKFWAAVGSGDWNGSGTASPDGGTGGLSYTVSGALYPFWAGGYGGDGVTADFNPSSTHSGLSTFTAWDGTAGASAALSGQAATGSCGTPAPSTSAAPTGLTATSAVGALSPSQGATVALSGVSAAGAGGALAASIAAGLAGASATGAVGALTVGAGATQALGGAQASGQAGSLALTAAVGLSSAPAAGQAGGLLAGLSRSMPGQLATSGQGNLAPGLAASLGGFALGVQVGALTPSGGAASVALAGASATLLRGSLAAQASSWIVVAGEIAGWSPQSGDVGAWGAQTGSMETWARQASANGDWASQAREADSWVVP